MDEWRVLALAGLALCASGCALTLERASVLCAAHQGRDCSAIEIATERQRLLDRANEQPPPEYYGGP